MKHTTVKQALQRVADYPVMLTDEVIDVPCHELICRALFDISNTPSGRRGAAQRANKARKIIFDRLVGKRRPGSHPATRKNEQVTFVDLTNHTLESGEEPDDDPDAEA